MTTLHVFPHTDRVDDWTAARLAEGSGAVLRTALTLRQLEELLVRTALDGRRRLSDAARSFALARVLAETPPPPFRLVAEKPGFRRAIERLWTELASGACTVRELVGAASKLTGAASERLLAVARLLGLYERRLADERLVDPAAALGEACRALESGKDLPDELRDVEVVRIEDVVDWPPSRLALVRALATALARRGGQVEVLLPGSDAPELEDLVEPAWRALESLPGAVQVERRGIRLPSNARAFTAANAEAELTEVARRVRSLLDEGVPPSQIVVAARGIAEFAPALERHFAAREIPVRHRRGRPLSESAVAKLALECARLRGERTTTAARVEAIIGSRLVDLRDLEPEAPSPNALVRLIREARIRDRAPDAQGQDGFDSRLARLARAKSHEENPRAVEEIDRARRTFAAFFAALDAWADRAPLRRHGRALLRLLETLRVPNRLRNLAFDVPRDGASEPDLTNRLQATALAHEQAAWSRLPSIVGDLAESASSVGLDDAPMSRTEFARWLEERFEAESIRPASARGVSVELAELADLAGRRVEHLFVVGAYDGRLPASLPVDALLSDDDRWRLNEALGRPVFRVPPRGLERSPLPPRQLAQGLDFALAAEAASNVTLSRPRADDRERPLAPSPLLALFDAEEESLPFQPLDAEVASRASESIAARREAALRRAEFFARDAASEFAGRVESVAPQLASFVPGTAERPLSAATVERAARCRFRHFAESLLGARPPPETGDEAGPLETGRLAHLAAEAAVKAMVERGLWSSARKDDAVAAGLDAARAVLDEAEPRTVLGSPDLWAIAREKLLGRLKRLLGLELDATEALELTPVAFELPFGREETPVPVVKLGDFHLAGKIDRLDEGPSGALVLDYKSGGSPALAKKLSADALLATEFQLPFYVVAARRRGASQADAGYVSLRDGARSKTLLAAAQLPWDELESRLENELRVLVDALSHADFSPRPQSCLGCHLRPVCRIPRPENA